MSVSEDNIILGMDKKIQTLQLRANNTFAVKKSSLSSATKNREFIKLESDDVSLYFIACSKKRRDVHYVEMKSGNGIYSFSSGEVVTSVKYSPNYKYLITSNAFGCIFIWKVPQNIEREIMFKSSQKTLRISEITPKNKNQFKTDGFAQEMKQQERNRKAWGEDRESHKPITDYGRETLPDWARSTVHDPAPGDNSQEEEEEKFVYQSKKNFMDSIADAVSDEDDSKKYENSEKEIELLGKNTSDGGETDEEADAFDFDQSRVRKNTISNEEIINRESRIGNILRNSIYEKCVSISRKTVSTPSESNINPKPSKLSEIIKKDSTKNMNKQKTIKEAKEVEKKHRIEHKSIHKSK